MEIQNIDQPEHDDLLRELHCLIERMDKTLMRIEESLGQKSEKSSGWVEITDSQRQKASDLRTELLIGKLPKDVGLMVDAKVMSQLLNVSSRTLSRLDDQQAIPAPIRLGNTMVRWRLTEILAWMDAGCPLRRNWTFPDTSVTNKRR